MILFYVDESVIFFELMWECGGCVLCVIVCVDFFFCGIFLIRVWKMGVLLFVKNILLRCFVVK